MKDCSEIVITLNYNASSYIPQLYFYLLYTLQTKDTVSEKVTQRMAHTYTNTPKASVKQSKSMPQPTTFQSLLSGVINGEKLL